MSEPKFLKFVIHLTDKAEVERLQARVDPGSNQAAGYIIRAPYNPGPPEGGAAIEYNAPIQGNREVFHPPCITSEWFASGDNFPTNVATFMHDGGSWLGWLFGLWGSVRFYWRGEFVYDPPPTPTPEVPGEPTVAAMSTRRWVDGFELPAGGEGGSGSSDCSSTAASRHVGGFGFRIQNSTSYKQHTNTENGGVTTDEMWERFYIRLLKAPGLATTLWAVRGTPNTQVGCDLQVTATGQIAVAGTGAGLYGTCGEPLPLKTWHKIDVLWKYGAATGYLKVFINGVQKFAMLASAMASGQGMNSPNTWTTSKIGNAAAGHLGTWDIDDWIGATIPVVGTNPDNHTAMDWLHGSKVVALEPTALGATHGSFAGSAGADATDYRHTFYRPVGWATVTHALSSTVSVDRCVVVVDVVRALHRPHVLGFAGFTVGLYGCKTGGAAADGQVGFKRPTVAETLVTVAENTVFQWSCASYFPAALAAPATMEAGLELVHVGNSTAGNLKTVVALMCAMELIGDFHPEDHVLLSDDNPDTKWGEEHWAGDMHNWAYYDSPWAVKGPPPIGPVVVHAGTYVGNSKSTQLAFRVPVHMIFIRRTSGGDQNTIWFSASLGAHISFNDTAQPEHLNQAMIDPNFVPAGVDQQSQQTILRIVGAGPSANLAGVTYQYLAFCDPAMRFLEVGCLDQAIQGATVSQKGSVWTPDIIWATREKMGGTPTVAFVSHGPGSGDHEVFYPSSAKWSATLETTGAGGLDTPAGSGLYAAGTHQVLFAAWRRDDASGDLGVKNVMQIASYTGDGGASRTISLAPVTNRRPMWAIIFSAATQSSYLRDPSHTGTNSMKLPATNDTTNGITSGGIDTISVGSQLNTNGIVYDVLVFPGCDAIAGGNGWGVSCENIPVNPGDGPVDPSPWDPEPDVPGDDPGGPIEPLPVEPDPGGGYPPGTPWSTYDFSETCIGPSTQVINLALSRIGISKQVGNILTESSAEATAARLHFSEDASATMRDFPWGFATCYEHLVLVTGDAREATRVQTWLGTTYYQTDEVVRVGGVDYYARVGNLNRPPLLNPTYWSTTAPLEANGDWLYAYRAPARMMFARRLVNPNKTRRDWDPTPPKFRLGSDDRGFVIYTNEVNPELEFTIRPLCVAGIDDALFRSALGWRHAHSIAPSLSRDAKTVAYAWAMYQALLNEARRWAVSEQQQAPGGDPDWISGRN